METFPTLIFFHVSLAFVKLKGMTLGNRAISKRHVDPDIFKSYIKNHNMSIRQLGLICQANERTIRRMLKDEEVTLSVALSLCMYFDCDFDDLFGPDDSWEWQRAVKFIQSNVR